MFAVLLVRRLAPLLPFIFPLFKQQHASTISSEALDQLELLLHVRTRNSYPSSVFPSTVNSKPMQLDATEPQAMKTKVEEFLKQHRASAVANASSSPSASSSHVSLLRDFPFLPIGLAPQDDGATLWLEEEEWGFSDEAVAVVVPNQVAAVDAPAPSVSSAPSAHIASEAMETDDAPSPAQNSLPAELPVKRARISEVAAAPVRPSPAAHAHTLQQHAASRAKALEQLQQSIAWV